MIYDAIASLTLAPRSHPPFSESFIVIDLAVFEKSTISFYVIIIIIYIYISYDLWRHRIVDIRRPEMNGEKKICEKIWGKQFWREKNLSKKFFSPPKFFWKKNFFDKFFGKNKFGKKVSSWSVQPSSKTCNQRFVDNNSNNIY